MLFNEVADIA